MGSSRWYDLATSILEEWKQATLNPDISTIIHLLNRILSLHPVPEVLPLVRLAEVLCTKQNESSDKAPPLGDETINEFAVISSVMLTYICTNNVVGVLERSPRRVDVKRAVGLFRDGLEPLPVRHPFRLTACSSVANALYTHFEQSGEQEDLAEAISLHRDALEVFPVGHPNRSASLNNLATSLARRFEQSGEWEDLDEVISLHRDALELSPAGHPSRSRSLNNLANSLTQRYEQWSVQGDLDEAVSLRRDALELRPAGHPHRFASLDSLATSLAKRFEQSGEREDLDEVISLHRNALELRPAGHPSRSRSLNNLANALTRRFGQSGEPADLDEAISLHRLGDALELRSPGHPDRFPSLDNFAHLLTERFEQSGEQEDLDEAVSLHRNALELRQAGHPDRSTSLNNLATSLTRRFEWSGEHHDRHEAISLQRDALKLFPAVHPKRSTALSNLTTWLTMRFEQSGEQDDLDESILLHRDALALVPTGHPNQFISLNNLATSLLRRFEQSGEQEDLDEAISLHRDALEGPAGHPDRSAFLNNLANSLTLKVAQSGEWDSLDGAIELFSKSIKLHASGHPSVCRISANFGSALMHAHSHTPEPKYIEMAMATYRDAVTCQTAPVSLRFRAARSWARYADEHNHKSAMDAYQAAVELLPGLAMLGSALHARQQALTSGSDGLARNAAACAIRSRWYDKAVELLEEGRAIFWSQALELRTPMTYLREVAPMLGSRLESLSSALERGSLRDTSRNPTDSQWKLMSMEQEARHFRRFNTEWLETLTEVRRLPGFEDFLRPSRLSTLQMAAVDAPVVILNASKSGCDALIMTSSNVKHIPLPNLCITDINKLVRLIRMASGGNSLRKPSLHPKVDDIFQLMTFNSDVEPSLGQLVESRQMKRVSDTRFDSEDIFCHVLHVLWISVMQPVINALNLEVC